MRKLCPLLFAALPLFATPPVVSNISFTYTGSAVTDIVFKTDTAWTAARIRYIESPGTCTEGTGGTVYVPIDDNTGVSITSDGIAGYFILTLPAMSPRSGTFQVCPEVTNDGTTWSSGAGAILQLKPASFTDANPIPAVEMDTTYPDLSKGTCWSNGQPGYCTIVVNTPCLMGGEGMPGATGTVDGDMATAISHQNSSGTIVLVPAGQTCNDSNMEWEAPSPDNIRFDQKQVSGNTITMPNALSSYTQAGPDGIVEGTGIFMSRTEYQGSYAANIPEITDLSGAVRPLPFYTYFAHVTGTNTMQLYWPWTHITGVSVISGSNTLHVTSLLGQGGPTPGVGIGSEVAGTGIPSGTTVTAISGTVGHYTITLSNAATASATEDLNFGGGDESDANAYPDDLGSIPNMPLQIIPDSSGLQHTGNYEDYMYAVPRQLYWVDLQSCVAGINCIASWNSTTSYAVGDKVNANNRVYTAIVANSGQAPPNASYWQDSGDLHTILASTLPPPGTRIDPTWKPNLATLEKPMFGSGAFLPFDCANENICLVSAGGASGDFYANSHIRLTGLRIVFSPNTESSSDPVTDGMLWSTNNQQSDIILDRILSDSSGYTPQNRTDWLANWNGHDMAIINSYLQPPGGWTASYSGVNTEWPSSTAQAPTLVNSTSFTIPATTVGYGAAQAATLPSTLTVSWTGTPSGSITTPEILVYFDMSGNLSILASTGLTVSASQPATIAYTSTNGSSTCNDTNPLGPTDFEGRGAFAPLACAVLTTGGTEADLVAGSVRPPPPNNGESGSCIYVADGGPGPWKFANNYFQFFDIGIIWSLESDWARESDFYIYRNTFHWPMQYISTDYNVNAKNAGMPTTHMHLGGHIQPLEWKTGNRFYIVGNKFSGYPHDWGSQGFAMDITESGSEYPAVLDSKYQLGPLEPGPPGATDVEIKDNTFEHATAGAGCGLTYNAQWAKGPEMRCDISNNLFWDINGLVYADTDDDTLGVAGGGEGQIFSLSSNDDGVTINHNTVYPFFGTEGIYLSSGGMDSLNLTNNFFPYSTALVGTYVLYGCGSGSAAMTCMNANFAGNVLMPLYNSTIYSGGAYGTSSSSIGYPPGTRAGSQYAASDLTTLFSGYTSDNTIMNADTDVPTTLGNVGWTALKGVVATPLNAWNSQGQYIGPVPDFHLLSGSQFTANHTTDGLQVGANINQLEAAQGKVTLVGANQITADSANITYVAPDATSCWVDYSNTDPTVINSFTRVQDAGGSRVRNVSITGLSSQTVYHFRVDCAVQQPSGQFRTN